MPAITVDDPFVLPRLARPEPGRTTDRPVRQVAASLKQTEGGGFQVARPFPGPVSLADSDPFLLLDHVGPRVNGPEEARGAPWHPHRDGPFVMNTREEIGQAIDDYHAGRLGVIPADQLTPRNYS